MSSTTLARLNTGRAVAAHEHEVLDHAVVELDVAANLVANDRRTVGDPEPQHAPRRRARGPDRATNPPYPVVPFGLGTLLDLLRASCRSSTHDPPREQPRRGSEMCARRSRSGTAAPRTAGRRPRSRSTASAVDDALRPLRPVARLVGVFDAQHERAAGRAGERPVEQRGAGTADVEEAGRRGSKSIAR